MDIDPRATVGASAPSEALASVLQALDVGVIIQDADLRITFANRRATELLGVSVDEITDRTTNDARWDVVTSDGSRVTGDGHPAVLAVRSGVAVRNVILGVRRPDEDQRVWIMASAIPEYDDGGSLERVVITVHDITRAQRAVMAHEALYRSVFRSMSDGVVVHDPDGSIRTANAAAERVLGLTEEQMTGRAALDPRWRLVTTDGDAAGPADIPSEIALATGEASGDRILGVHRPNGERAWLSVRADPLREPGDDTLRGVVATFTDVTVERESDLELRASRAQIQRLLDAVPGVVFQYQRTTDGDERIPVVAGRVHDLLDLDRGPDESGAPSGAPLSTSTMFRGASDDDRAEIARRLDDSIEARTTLTFEFAVRTPTGSTRWLSLHGVPDDTDDGPVVTCFVTDSTEPHRLAEVLRRSQRDDVLGQLSAGVAHNFNNMLAVIVPSLEPAAERVDDDSTQHLLDQAQRAAQSAADLVRRMLALGRGEPSAGTSTADLVPIVHGAAEICRRTFDRTIALDVRVERRDAWVHGVPTDLEQLVLNLLFNARDAVSDTERPRIDVEVAGDDEILLRVRDNGSGMDPGTVARLGEPFFSTKVAGRGTGLGLASVFRTVSEAGGTWEVDSARGAGTVVTVRFPPAVPSADTETPEVDRQLGDDTDRADIVLVVDDEALVRETLGLQLTALGYTTMLASGAGEALAALGEVDHDRLAAVILDLSMPDVPGARLLPDLLTAAPGVPVVVLSGDVADPERLTGASAILQKPVRQAELARVLRSVTGRTGRR